MVTYLTWTALRFGKHEGNTLPKIVLSDPGWFFWAEACGIFRDPQDSEAQEIGWRARNIKIPKPDPENWRVEYFLSPDFRFLDFSIIDSKSAQSASSNSMISTHLDLSLPRIVSIESNRPLGYDLMLEKFRHYYFDGSDLPKTECETFFYRRKNFIWPD